MKDSNIRRRRPGIITGSVAFFTGLSLLLFPVYPVDAQTSSQTVVCYSVITVEEGTDLVEYANRYHTTVAEIMKLNAETELQPGVSLTLQDNTLDTLESKEISRGGSDLSWNWPLMGVISSDYGWRNGDFHHGIDIATPSGSLVRAARAGKVIKADWNGVYGLTVIVDHGNGVQTLYAHNSKLLVQLGDRVVVGEGVSISGNTGNSTGPHLHFEIRIKGKTVDPEYYLPKTSKTTIAGSEIEKTGS